MRQGYVKGHGEEWTYLIIHYRITDIFDQARDLRCLVRITQDGDNFGLRQHWVKGFRHLLQLPGSLSDQNYETKPRWYGPS